MPSNAISVFAVIDFFLRNFHSNKKNLKSEPTILGHKLLWKITSIYMLKNFHKFFFENLSDPIPTFLTPYKMGLLSNENTEIVKILAPLTDNPNAPDKNGDTPIYKAAWKGNLEIVKYLAHLTDKPNASNNQGRTPFMATKNEEIRRILKSYKKSKKRTANAEPPTTKSAKHARKK